jgi:hypothetical protein
LEVERDQAQFRTLELEETIHNAVGIFKSASGNLSAALAVIDPPKPVPVVEQPTSVTGQSDDPFASSPANLSPAVHSDAPQSTTSVSEQVPASPPSTSYPEPSGSGQPTPTADPVGFTGLSETDTSVKTPGKFTGKRWSDIPASECPYNYSEWFANGGDAAGWNS